MKNPISLIWTLAKVFLAVLFVTHMVGMETDLSTLIFSDWTTGLPLTIAALQVEIWEDDIAKNLFPPTSFMSRSIDDSMWATDGKTVHLPQEGGNPDVVKNRSSLPATVSKRTDSEITYDLDEYTTDPILLGDTEEAELSYNKRMSILSQHINTLNDRVASELLYKWAATASGQQVRTTGSGRAPKAAGQTANRKAVTKADIISALEVIGAADVPTENSGLVMVIPNYLMSDIMALSDFMDADKYGRSNLPGGSIGRILGFDVYLRSKVARFDNSGTPVPKAVGAANAADDNLSILCYHTGMVRRAQGTVKVFSKDDSPTYYGDIFSALVRMGGSKKYTDGKGVVSIVESAV